MKRSVILDKINKYTLNNDLDSAIELLCELIEENNNNFQDLIAIIIENFQLYGYLNGEIEKKFNTMFNKDINQLRVNSYSGKYLNKMNYGQLSIINEIHTKNKTLISAPTSFGKTSLLLEYIIDNNIILNNIIFVVPTHSLIEELYIKLLKINKSFINKYNITVNIGKKYERNIRILTPERFLTYYEYNNLDNIDLIIMDETYKIDSKNINIDDNDIEFENKSYVQNNFEDVSDLRELKFRKVLEIIGNFNKKVIMLSPYTYEKDESMKKYMEKYNVTEQNQPIKYVTHKYINLTNVTQFKKEFNISITSDEYGSNIPLKIYNILNQIKTFQNIIYVSYPLMGARILNELKNHNICLLENKEDKRYQIFLNHLTTNYNVEELDEWYVITALKLGIGMYVSSMPRYLKREIVNLYNKGIIKTLIVTTAFIEGVNSTAKNIIIASGTTGGNKQLNNLSLLNIVGRAGRFGTNYMGNVYFIQNDPFQKVIQAKDNGVKLKNPNYEKNTSSINRTDYELEMIDNEFLNTSELNRKNQVIEILRKNNYDYNELSKISLAVPNVWKALLYEYLKNNCNINEVKEKVEKIIENDNDKFIESINYIFEILKKAIHLNDSYTFSGVPPFTKDGKFIWADLYKIHKNDNIKKVLISNKKYIEQKKNEFTLNYIDYRKTWIKSYYNSRGTFLDSKLYEKTFKFISDVIEYKIPYYINFFISIFKYYVEKENIEFNSDIALEEIIEKVENNFIDDKLIKFYDYGFPKNLIDKISKIEENIESINIDTHNEFDEFEKVILKEFVDIMN